MRDLLDALERAERGSGFPERPPSLDGFVRYRTRRVRRERILAATLALIVGAAAVGSVITAFRQSNQGVPTAPSISPTNVGDLRLEWKAELDGPAASLGNRFSTDEPFAPTVGDGRVFVGTEAGTLRAYKIGCGSGGSSCDPLWTADLGAAVAFAPTFADDRVFVATEGGGLYAFDAYCAETQCTPIFEAHLPDTLLSAPVVSDGLVLGIGSLDSTLYVFPESCHGRCDPSWTSVIGPVPSARKQAEMLQKNEFLTKEVELAPVVSDEVVYALDFFDHTLHAIDARTRSTSWIGKPTQPLQGGVRFNGPVVAGDEVLYEAGSYVYAFPLDCGTSGRICKPDWTTEKLDIFVGKPVVSGDTVYIGTAVNGQLGHVFAFPLDCRTDGGACKDTWQASVPGELTIEQTTVADGQVLVVSNYANLIASLPTSCGSATCETTWQADSLRQPIAVTPIPGLLFVDTGGGQLLAFPSDCRGTCSPLWNAKTNGPVSPPTIADGKLYAGTANGTLYAFGVGGPRHRPSSSSDPTPFVYLGIFAVAAVLFIARTIRRRRQPA